MYVLVNFLYVVGQKFRPLVTYFFSHKVEESDD